MFLYAYANLDFARFHFWIQFISRRTDAGGNERENVRRIPQGRLATQPVVPTGFEAVRERCGIFEGF